MSDWWRERDRLRAEQIARYPDSPPDDIPLLRQQLAAGEISQADFDWLMGEGPDHAGEDDDDEPGAKPWGGNKRGGWR